jgi:hypothetical protein
MVVSDAKKDTADGLIKAQASDYFADCSGIPLSKTYLRGEKP